MDGALLIEPFVTMALDQGAVEVTTIEADLAGQINLPSWTAEVDVETLRFLNERMVRYGLLDEEIVVEDIVTPIGD